MASFIQVFERVLKERSELDEQEGSPLTTHALDGEKQAPTVATHS